MNQDSEAAAPRSALLDRFSEKKEVDSLLEALPKICSDSSLLEASAEKFTVILDKYQEQPHLLDSFLEELVGRLLGLARHPNSPHPLVCQSFKFLYILSKVRGHKSMARLFPHEVAHLEPVLKLAESQDPSDVLTWEIRYVSLLWLSILVMAPFDMKRFDSDSSSSSITHRIIAVCKNYVQRGDKSQDAAALLFAKFVTRPDISRQNLGDAFKWLCEVLKSCEQSMVICQGVLSSMAKIFKHGKREDLQGYGAVVLETLVKNGTLHASNNLLRKLSVKLIQRIGAVFLGVKIASWRYQRGNRSLTHTFATGSTSKVKMVESFKDGTFFFQSNQTAKEEKEEEEEEYNVPEIIEEILEFLFFSLKDKDTIVRWSAAKGIGRITGRLPRDLADDVITTLLGCFSLQESDRSWHSGCLALAELGRRGLLLPGRLSEVIPVVVKALLYDERKGLVSVGSMVRDAACYVCWSFARAYDPQEFLPYVEQIAVALVITTVFDREINCRRAASAAFQENVGRQGVFPHGIEIVTAADFFAVGIRSEAYLQLSLDIARFPEYTHPLIDHLVNTKICHWDSAIRELSSQALHKFTLLDPDYVTDKVYDQLLNSTDDIDLNMRHGSLLSLGEITHALGLVAIERKSTLEISLGSEKLAKLRDVVPKFLQMNSQKGPHGDMMRYAVCRLIEKLSLAAVPYHGRPIIREWQCVIDDNLPYICHDDSWIQTAALQALKALSAEYYRKETASNEHANLIAGYLKRLQSSLDFDRMGFSLGLGTLPKCMFQSSLNAVLNGLVETSSFCGEKESDSRFAEARRDAVIALGNVCSTVGLRTTEPCLSQGQVNLVFDALLRSMEDYTSDKRADVGSWVRKAAIETIEKLVDLVVNTAIDWLTPETIMKIICCLFQQMNERIDRIRQFAGNVFIRFLHKESPAVPHFKHQEALKEIFPLSEVDSLSWFRQPYCFERTVKVLSFPEYRCHSLLGFVASVGGLTASLEEYSSAALLQCLNEDKEGQTALSNVLRSLVQIFQKFLKNERVTVPIFKTIDLLFGNCYLENLSGEEDKSVLLDLCNACKKETFNSGNTKKIIDSISVFCGFLQFPGKIRTTALERLLVLLCHKYPRARKEVADQLYVILLSVDDVAPVDAIDKIQTLLTETSWCTCVMGVGGFADDCVACRMSPDGNWRGARDRLCDLFGVARPKTKASVKPKGPGDQSSSKPLNYQDLVDRVGY
eukprot:m.243932 g.243932  ORF g.243932 m.243932 type:complete len:1220 (+) comp40242_c1_seq17:38-3697(+)